MSKRVYFITSNQMKVFEWHDKKLLGSSEFKNNEQGLRDFSEYLNSVKPVMSHVLVELLEEDFQREKIPHVYGKDRQALIKRQVDRHYSHSPYTHSHIIGREKDGRKDDEILLTCIFNTEPIQLWMEKFEQYKIPIMGIWSLPILSEDYAKRLPVESKNVLLVSRQMRSTLRESYFREGKLLLSRQVKLNRDIRAQHTAAAYLTDGVEQIHKFLSNKRTIQFGDTLDVYCLMPEDLIAEAKNLYRDTDLLRYHFLPLHDAFVDCEIISHEEKEADALFAGLCARKRLGTAHYKLEHSKKLIHNHVVDKGISYISTLGSLCLLLLACLLFVMSYETNNKQKVTDVTTARLLSYYDKNFAHIEEQLNSADTIRETVALYTRLKKETTRTPEQFLTPLGSILSRQEFSVLSVKSLSWEKYSGSELNRLREEIWSRTTVRTDEYQEYEYDEESLRDKVPVVVLMGKMQRENINYSDTVFIMQKFVEHLRQLPEVEQLLVVKTPVDIRVSSNFSDQSGADPNLRYRSDEANMYEIMLLLKPTESGDEHV